MEMDGGMDMEPPTFEFKQLVEAKNCLQRILLVAEEQDEMIGGLAAAEQSMERLDFANCMGAFSMHRANASSNKRLSLRVDKHMNELRERLMAQRNVLLNQRLALLTIQLQYSCHRRSSQESGV